MDKTEIQQGNALTEAAYTLDLQQKRVILIAILNSNKNGVASVTTTQFSKTFNVRKNHSAQFIKDSRASLLSANILIESDDGFVLTNWLSSIEYKEKSERMILTFAPRIIKEITGLKKRFTKFCLMDVGQMKNVYFIRLYMMLSMWRSTGRFSISVQALRDNLQIGGSYPAYANFKAKVLLRACEEITDKTNFTVKFEETRTGKKITHLEFLFYEKIPMINHK